jgi:hypothetical protein
VGILSKDPERKQAKADARAAQAQEREKAAQAKAAAQAEAAFRASPAGRARTARELGHQLFQISLPLTATERTAWGVFSGGTAGSDALAMRTTSVADHPDVLESVEREGWRLEHAGYVFQETGSVSRDKLLSSGQTASVTGAIVGIYLFRRMG